MANYLLSEDTAARLAHLINAKPAASAVKLDTRIKSEDNSEWQRRARPFEVTWSNELNSWLIWLPVGSLVGDSVIHPLGLTAAAGRPSGWYVIEESVTGIVQLEIGLDDEGKIVPSSCWVTGNATHSSDYKLFKIAEVDRDDDGFTKVNQYLVGELVLANISGGGGGGDVPEPPSPYYSWQELDVVISSTYNNSTREFRNNYAKIWTPVLFTHESDVVFTATPLVT